MELMLVCLSGALFVYMMLLLIFGSSGKEMVRGRLARLLTNQNLDSIHDEVLKEKRREAKKSGNSGLRIISRKFENDLMMSGIKLSANEYLCSWIGATLLPVLLMLLMGSGAITLLGIGIVGFAIPPMLVGRAKKKRQQEFNKQLSESLLIIGNCIRSGYSFQQAMKSISTDMPPPISTEFAKTLTEIRYGVSQEEALNRMVDRVQNRDLEMLVTAVKIVAQVGGNLSDILETIAFTIKDRLRIKDEIRILTATGRISGMVIGMLPVIIAVILMIINPGYIQSFVYSGLGKVMILVGVILEAIGFFAIRAIIDLKY